MFDFTAPMTPQERKRAEERLLRMRGKMAGQGIPDNLGEGLDMLGQAVVQRVMQERIARTPDANGFLPAPAKPNGMSKVAAALFGRNFLGPSVAPGTKPFFGKGGLY